jgi:ribosomal protein S1
VHVQGLAVPVEALQAGDAIAVAVTGIDRERRQLTLSPRAVSADSR